MELIGIKSLFCGFYCISFLVKCIDANEKEEYEEFLMCYKGREYSRNEKVCTDIIKKALVKAN